MPRKDKDNETEAAVFPRPAPAEIRAAWITLFSDPLLSLANLKAVAAAGLGAPDEEGGITLRSVYWRFYFGILPPPTSLDLFPASLAASRQAYNDLRTRFLVAPDGRWASDCSGGEGYQPTASASSPPNGTAWDPLSLDGDSPWKTWFAHLELRETIRQDVDRTFPDIPYFALDRVRRCLTTMLFIFAVLNPDVGYRQGMHELLAVCFMVVDRDSLDESGTPDVSPVAASPLSPLPRAAGPPGMLEAMNVTLDRDYIEHDAFGLFQELMKPAKSFYEWRAEEGPGRQLLGAPQAPILTRCNHIQTQLLRKIDPQLWERMEQEGVEAQIWAIRWIRLILTRELPFPMALRLWDGIFAADPNLGILDFVCVAMLLLIRNELIEADYPSILTHLLHYPAPSDTYPFNPSLILAQANFLQHDVSPTAGVEVVLQNQELLGVKATDRSRINLDVDSPTAWRPGRTPSPRTMSARDRARAGMSGLAAGLFERAQKAGLDKAFLSTVNDLRNNLPDASTAYSFLPSFSPGPQKESLSPSPSRGENPFTVAGLPNRPPQVTIPSSDSDLSIKSMLDAERQMAELRLSMVTMGKAMSQWMDTIKEANASGSASGEAVAEAWAGLDRVRDSLLDAAGRDVDAMVKDWAWNDDLGSSRSQASSAAPTSVTETTEAFPTKTPTRPVFDEHDKDVDAVIVRTTPKQQAKARMDPPPAIPIPPNSVAVPPAPATARPSGVSASASTSTPLSTSPLTNASFSAPNTGVPQKSPEIFLSRRDDRPSPSLTRTIHSPRASVATLPSAAALARVVSGGSDKIKSSPSPSISTESRPAASSNTTTNTSAGTPLPQPTITPPPRSSSSRASAINPKLGPLGAGFNSTPPPSVGAPSSDPLAGLDVGSMPRSSSSRSGHERKRSAWRVSAPAGSVPGSEPVGMDPLGARG